MTSSELTSAILPIFTILTFVGVLVVGWAYVSVLKKKGASDGAKEVINLKDEQINTYKEQLKIDEEKRKKQEEDFNAKLAKIREDMKESNSKYQEEVKLLTGKIGELTGLLAAQENQNILLKEILANRTPDMDNFFKAAVPIFQRSADYMEKTGPVIDGIASHMKNEVALFQNIEKAMTALISHLNLPVDGTVQVKSELTVKQ